MPAPAQNEPPQILDAAGKPCRRTLLLRSTGCVLRARAPAHNVLPRFRDASEQATRRACRLLPSSPKPAGTRPTGAVQAGNQVVAARPAGTPPPPRCILLDPFGPARDSRSSGKTWDRADARAGNTPPLPSENCGRAEPFPVFHLRKPLADETQQRRTPLSPRRVLLEAFFPW